MCERCKDGGCLISHDFNLKDGTKLFNRLRFDLDNNQLDMQYGTMDEDHNVIENEWSYGVDISVCPFCGTRLPITMTVDEFYNKFNAIVRYNNSDNFKIEDIEVNKYFTNHYKTDVEYLYKDGEYITIYFRNPGYNI